MRSCVDTALIVNSKLTEYPYHVDVKLFDIRTKTITKNRCVRNVIDSMYKTKVIDSFEVIGYYGIITRYLALTKRIIMFV